MRTIIIGNIGSDAGYWIIDGTGLHHVGGWGVDSMAEFTSAIRIMSEATRLKTPGLAESAIKTVRQFAETELSKHLKDGAAGSVVVVVA